MPRYSFIILSLAANSVLGTNLRGSNVVNNSLPIDTHKHDKKIDEDIFSEQRLHEFDQYHTPEPTSFHPCVLGDAAPCWNPMIGHQEERLQRPENGLDRRDPIPQSDTPNDFPPNNNFEDEEWERFIESIVLMGGAGFTTLSALAVLIKRTCCQEVSQDFSYARLRNRFFTLNTELQRSIDSLLNVNNHPYVDIPAPARSNNPYFDLNEDGYRANLEATSGYQSIGGFNFD